MKAVALAYVLALLAAGCAHPAAKPAAPRKAETVLEKPRVRSGELITYKNGAQIGRETWTDDGDLLKSEVSLAGSAETVTIGRKARRVTVAAAGKTLERDVAEGVVALENGDWQAYALAAEAFAAAVGPAPTPIKVLVPKAGAVLPATILVTSAAGGGKHVALAIRGLEVEVDLDASGSVIRASVPAQGLEVRPAGEPAPEPLVRVRPPPAGVTEEAIDVNGVRGSLWIPEGATRVALIVAGSGPTDREGNSALGLKTDTYRLLAQALATRGIATLRYDKRGVGESAPPANVTTMTAGDLAADASALVTKLRGRFASVTVIGHSEGGLLALLAAETTRIDSLVLVATGGRPLRAIIHEQLANQLDATTLAQADKVMDDIAAGRPLENVPPALSPVFNRSNAAYLKSELDIDPVARLRGLKVPTTVVQGETDVQVSVADARLLEKARSGVRVVVVPGMNHVLKAETSRAMPQASYSDPTLPIVPAAIDAIAAAIAK